MCFCQFQIVYMMCPSCSLPRPHYSLPWHLLTHSTPHKSFFTFISFVLWPTDFKHDACVIMCLEISNESLWVYFTIKRGIDSLSFFHAWILILEHFFPISLPPPVEEKESLKDFCKSFLYFPAHQKSFNTL